MMQGYYLAGKHQNLATFELTFRKGYGNQAWLIFAGLESVLQFIKKLRFTEEDIRYLSNMGFDSSFLRALEDFKFTGDIFSLPEGTVFFPREPALIVQAPLWEAQYLETMIVNFIGFQTLVATKAKHYRFAARDKQLIEMGLRRGHGFNTEMSRAARIGGFDYTSNVEAGRLYSIPTVGTMAHSWVMSFQEETEAFISFANHGRPPISLLLDTYSTLDSGLPHALKVITNREGISSIRLDSGNLLELSKTVREELDYLGDEGQHVKIIVSGDLTPDSIATLEAQNAPIDMYGVGSALATLHPFPIHTAVYKLCQIIDSRTGQIRKICKKSDSPAKTTLPGRKTLVRDYDTKKDTIVPVLPTYNHTSPQDPFIVAIKQGQTTQFLPTMTEKARQRLQDTNELVFSPDWKVEIDSSI